MTMTAAATRTVPARRLQSLEEIVFEHDALLGEAEAAIRDMSERLAKARYQFRALLAVDRSEPAPQAWHERARANRLAPRVEVGS